MCAEVHNLLQRNDRLVNEVHKSISAKNLSDQKMRTKLLKAESQAHTQVSHVCWSHTMCHVAHACNTTAPKQG